MKVTRTQSNRKEWDIINEKHYFIYKRVQDIEKIETKRTATYRNQNITFVGGEYINIRTKNDDPEMVLDVNSSNKVKLVYSSRKKKIEIYF
jgi:hypothetical protein